MGDAAWPNPDLLRWARIAFARARSHLKDTEDVKDVVQDVLVALLVLFRSGRPPDCIETWVSTAAKHKAIDIIRRRHGDSPLNPDLELEESPDGIMSVLNKMIIEGLLPALPPRERQAIKLRYLEEFDLSAIAETMGITVNTVKTLLRRGLEHLRREVRGRDV